MHFQQLSIAGEDFVGLLGVATDAYVILAPPFPDLEVFSQPTLRTKVYGTQLVGLFCAGNSHGLLLPYFAKNDTKQEIQAFFDREGIDARVGIVDDKHTALGNLVAANDRAVLASPKLTDTSVIEDTLGVDVTADELYGGHEEVGSCLAVTNRGLLAHPDAEKELDKLKDLFKVPEANVGSVNFGVPYVGAGLLANSEGYVTGSATSGIEMGRIDDALGFL